MPFLAFLPAITFGVGILVGYIIRLEEIVKTTKNEKSDKEKTQ